MKMNKYLKCLIIAISIIVLFALIYVYCKTSNTPIHDLYSIIISIITAFLFYIMGLKSTYSKREQNYIDDFYSIERSIHYGEENVYKMHQNIPREKTREIILQSWYIIFVQLKQWSINVIYSLQHKEINGKHLYNNIYNDLNDIVIEYKSADKHNRKEHLQGCYHFGDPKKLLRMLKEFK